MAKELKLVELSKFEVKRKEMAKFYGGHAVPSCDASCSGVGQNDNQKDKWFEATSK